MSSTDLGIALPHGWQRSSDPARGVLVTARAGTAPASGVRPHVTLVCEPVTLDAAAWASERITTLAGATHDFALEDDDVFDLDGHDIAYRRYAHRVAGVDVLCDEWAWLLDGLGLVLTGTVAREDYADYCDVFEAIAETLDPPRP